MHINKIIILTMMTISFLSGCLISNNRTYKKRQQQEFSERTVTNIWIYEVEEVTPDSGGGGDSTAAAIGVGAGSALLGGAIAHGAGANAGGTVAAALMTGIAGGMITKGLTEGSDSGNGKVRIYWTDHPGSKKERTTIQPGRVCEFRKKSYARRHEERINTNVKYLIEPNKSCEF